MFNSREENLAMLQKSLKLVINCWLNKENHFKERAIPSTVTVANTHHVCAFDWESYMVHWKSVHSL